MESEDYTAAEVELDVRSVSHRISRPILATLRICNTQTDDAAANVPLLEVADTSAFLLCYAVNNRTSFNSIKEYWIPELSRYRSRFGFVLVACKVDLRTKGASKREFVSRREGERLAKKFGAKFVETSASQGENVIEALDIACFADPRLWRRYPRKNPIGGCSVS